MNMIVGGNLSTGKLSRILTKLHYGLSRFYDFDLYNGRKPDNISGSDLTIWMPDIDNSEEKEYPIKDKGSVLICSKVMRYGYNKGDAVSRIFKMNGNAVIAIYKSDKWFEFELIDALGNTWVKTENLDELSSEIVNLYLWTKGSIRISYEQQKNVDFLFDRGGVNELLNINNKLSDRVTKKMGERYFGNLSCRCFEKTRCMKLFTSQREQNGYLISPRNSNKEYLTPEEFVFTDNYFNFYGDSKPSVDTPVQIAIYQMFPNINYMIHGHLFIKYAPTTKEYYPCGDLREIPEIIRLLRHGISTINLKSHGFLIVSDTLDKLNKTVDSIILE